MNKHICKARIKNSKEWVYGYYVYHEDRQICPVDDELKDSEKHHLILFDGTADWNMPQDIKCCEVIGGTVCQYSGVNDKKGKEIFDKDLLIDENGYKWICYYKEGGFALCRFKETVYKELSNDEVSKWVNTNCEVTGNIFNNYNSEEESERFDDND